MRGDRSRLGAAPWARAPRRIGALLVTALASATACSVGLGDLPLPAPGGGDGYTVRAEFANALNLPAKAKVRLLGADVGEVAEMAVHDYTAVVTLRIEREVRLPLGTRAELRTATPLGDVFVSLTPPAEVTAATPALADGDRLAKEQTASAATIEELLSTAALLVNGGAIRNLTTLVNGLGRAVGERGEELSALIAQSTHVVRTLAARSEDIRATLAGIDALARTLDAQRAGIDGLIEAAGPALQTLDTHAAEALELVRRVESISARLATLPGLDGEQTTGMVADLNRIAAGLSDAATHPQADLGALNAMLGPIISVTTSTSANVDADFQDLALGYLPDPNHPGDPESRLPDLSDWAAFIGTFTYTLLKLQEKITGGAR
ncbi:MAG TPA: MlaD family protein [Nocardia sp.]|uniref:MlaD family protein n=1 Tax=Nocardia TaxID=1817 RepID=UPI002455B11B|nr:MULTISPECIES: MlaD family protein [Nocardia]HLS77270.1 MlaD family protein [Nocardia sp.]